VSQFLLYLNFASSDSKNKYILYCHLCGFYFYIRHDRGCHDLIAAVRCLSPSNFVLKLTTLTVETLSYFAVKTAWSYLQLFYHYTLASHRQTTTSMTIAELAMQLQRSTKMWPVTQAYSRLLCLLFGISLLNKKYPVSLSCFINTLSVDWCWRWIGDVGIYNGSNSPACFSSWECVTVRPFAYYVINYCIVMYIK